MARALVAIAVFVVAVVSVALVLEREDENHGGPRQAARGSNQSPEAKAPPVRLVDASSEVLAACASLRSEKRLRVLCPRRLPRATWRVRYRSLEQAADPCLIDLRVDAQNSRTHHVLAGGRRHPFSLKTSDGEWPARVPAAGVRCCSRTGDLGLVGARRAASRRRGFGVNRDPGQFLPGFARGIPAVRTACHSAQRLV